MLKVTEKRENHRKKINHTTLFLEGVEEGVKVTFICLFCEFCNCLYVYIYSIYMRSNNVRYLLRTAKQIRERNL